MSLLIVLFCGFYVAGSDQQLLNDATQVVMMRKGTRTVLAMENSYQGPPEAFAMVVPVPAVLHEGDVKTLTKDVFRHVEQMGAPRLVEYWEQDPCAPPIEEGNMSRQKSMTVLQSDEPSDRTFGVKIEAKFAVGEYQIVILSAKDSTGLDAWLRENKYNIPAGAEPLLRPYVESNMKFFVAKVDPTKVKFEDNHAVLSPLRFHYDSDEFSLPIRLGMANSPGKQDLIVNILAPSQRYRVSNYPNATIPTNLDVRAGVKAHFGTFYAALFDATLAKNPGAVVTEYAWQASSCDPCPGPTLSESELQVLGADVLGESSTSDFVLTRLHARYGPDLEDDLRFEAAKPIVGGREMRSGNEELEHGAQPADFNNFQARYAIRHKWEGPITCEHPHRGVWGGNPGGNPTPTPALDLAHVPRTGVDLATSVVGPIAELGVAPAAPAASSPTSTAPPASTKKTGCGCDASDPAGLGALIALAFRRPSRRRRRLMRK